MEDNFDSAKTLKDDLYKQLARIGKCLSSDKRLEILNVLANGAKTVENIALTTEMNIANVSRHLQILLDAKLVKFNKKGTYAIYSLADPDVIHFLSSLWRISEKQLPDISKLKEDFLNNLDDVKTLSLTEVINKRNTSSMILIDLRPKNEYEEEHIPGAISIPIEELDESMRQLPKDAEIVAYCRGPVCAYSALAAQKLQVEGYTAYRMDEGIIEWQDYALMH
ncbi:metalloregulator ArsR/SmtB family transcription factor [Paenibacillus sp. KACC 21273]|uniref:ArsR/SmtB family transcription factor n=1 Tax=Paenibacillus sp. KACC 21273 TaxID=3025665 RepID=UPI0023656192|nr:metalloregulator ArsR/SmtB family transcription factor [Paenibacillus sp. KACC 21273]WDF48859.1 metalloregulator ArsR/SmtB family transcription factor [Paenibacillus sp. KACC 21273]